MASRHRHAAQRKAETGSRNSHGLDVNALGADEAWAAVHMQAAPLLQLGKARVALLLGQRAYRGPGLVWPWLGRFQLLTRKGQRWFAVGVLRRTGVGTGRFWLAARVWCRRTVETWLPSRLARGSEAAA